MFTGIVEEIGKIKSIVPSFPAAKLEISAKKALNNINVGDSIAIDGVCLTVISFTSNSFAVEVQNETQKLTKFQQYHEGSYVNLERAVTPETRIGGHYVQGHIDAKGIVRAWHNEGQDWVLRVSVPEKIRKYIVKKGFIALDGMSLTVTEISEHVAVHVIPHTRSVTTLQYIKTGDYMNIEVDIIAKYVEKISKF